MSSLKQYWNEPFVFSGETTVTATSLYKEKPALALATSLFYPEGGGQLGDRGTIRFGEEVRRVLDTQSDDKGTIFVILDRVFSQDLTGQSVTVVIDEEWRRRQMAQHTGQHLLSRLLHDAYNAPTVSARLGETLFSIDLDITSLSLARVTEAEEHLNKLILEDRPIRAWFPNPEELTQLDLRKQPTVTEGIRVIQVEGFDVTPCGGTHCARTGQIGMVHILSTEKYKNMTRIYACAGLDAVRQFRTEENALQEAQTCLNATLETLTSSITAIRAREQAAETRVKELTKRLAQQDAEKHLNTTEDSLLIIEGTESDMEYARELSKTIMARSQRLVLILIPTESDLSIVMDQSQKGSLNIGALLKPILTAHEGKGGGGPFHAEGRIPASAKDAFLQTCRATFWLPLPDLLTGRIK